MGRTLPDYYSILGVLPSSSPNHIKRTFRWEQPPPPGCKRIKFMNVTS
jgi:hypothetical protein